jgi:hypothetical protein
MGSIFRGSLTGVAIGYHPRISLQGGGGGGGSSSRPNSPLGDERIFE